MKSRDQRLRSLFPLWGSGSVRELPQHRTAGLEIVYVSQGHLRWRIENRVYEPGPGSVFYTFPWELHGSLEEFEPGHRWDFVVLKILGRFPSRRFALPSAFGLATSEGRRLLNRLMHSPHRSLAAGKRLKWLLPTLQEELSSPHGADFSMAVTLGKALLLELDRIVARATSEQGPFVARRPDHCEILLRRLHSDYASVWTLKTMSQITGLGRTRLSQLVKERTGDSPIVYLNRRRIGKAQELLRNTGQPITDIAFDCGFQSSQYFARTFKHLTGKTPRDYRSSWQKKNGPLPKSSNQPGMAKRT
jgi:AraC family L-rhamnose operon regulatory protein RhaS